MMSHVDMLYFAWGGGVRSTPSQKDNIEFKGQWANENNEFYL